MKEDKEYTDGIVVKKGKFLTWLDNFWYHNKWTAIVAAFLVVVIVVCIVQSFTKTNYDLTVTYAGPQYLTLEQKANIKKVLEENLPEGFSKKAPEVNALGYYIMSMEQIEEAEKETTAEGYPVEIDRSFITDEKSTFESQLMTGAGSVLLLDPSIFESLGGNASSERLKPLSEVLEKVPEGAVSNFGIKLGSTEIYREYAALQVLPEDTVICLHMPILGQKNYDKEIEAFKAFTKQADKPESGDNK